MSARRWSQVCAAGFRVAAVWIGTLGVVASLATSCAGHRPTAGTATTVPARSPALNPAVTATCPEVIAGPGLAGFELFDRELPPLGRGLIGNRTTYRRGAASIEVAIGPNVVDELEDLDLDSRPTPPSTKSISLFASKAVGAIQVAIWTDADVPTRCQEISVLARGVDEATVLQIVEGLSISPNAEPPADATR